jgi:hypothetical protein
MKVFEMKPDEIGEAVETVDAIVVTLKKENRVIVISKNDLKMGAVSLVSIKDTSGYNCFIPSKRIIPGGGKTVAKTVLKKKTVVKNRLAKMTYLPVKEDARLGKSLNDSLALNVYKKYGYRLWNNVMADVMSRVNGANSDAVNNEWFMETIKEVYSKYGLEYSKGKHSAVIMWLKGISLVSSKRVKDKHMVYTIHRKPEIPKTIET